MKKLAVIVLFINAIFLNGCDHEATLIAVTSDARILAFGDSLTYGTGTTLNNAYPAVLARLSQRTVINAGIPGEISALGLQRLPSLLATHHPELIIICHGANDILRKLNLKKTKKNLQKMIDLAQNQGTQVVLVAVPAFSLFLRPHDFYIDLAEENTVPIITDSLADILKNNQLKSDQIHPNKQGYQKLGESIYQKIVASGGLQIAPKIKQSSN